MNRRRFIFSAGVAAAAAGALAAWRYWPEQGIWNPCLGPLPPRLAAHELVKAAWEGIDASKVWDAHAHLVGTGDSPSGIMLSPKMENLLEPADYARRLFFLNAGCAHGTSVDESYVRRMRDLVGEFPQGVKVLLFAFDRAFDESGSIRWNSTSLYVPDAYARATAQRFSPIFEWVASIHPYRRDCVEALEAAQQGGARAVKWLPSAMGIDPGSPLCDRFYAAAARIDLPLISHAGLERAVAGSDVQALGNPLRLRRALDAGVRVVVAHCASMGEDRDLDKGPNGPYIGNFDLFARLMDEPRHAGRLFGDISALTQTDRAGIALARVIRESGWHARLLNGSDYPLPGLMPIFSVDYLVTQGWLEAAAAPILTEIRRHNPMLFDFVAKRSLRADGRRLGAAIFETRGFFDPLSRMAQKNQ